MAQLLLGRVGDGDDERAVDPRAEARGEPVVGLALGGLGREVAVVGLAELEARGGDGERGGAGGADGKGGPRVAGGP